MAHRPPERPFVHAVPPSTFHAPLAQPPPGQPPVQIPYADPFQTSRDPFIPGAHGRRESVGNGRAWPSSQGTFWNLWPCFRRERKRGNGGRGPGHVTDLLVTAADTELALHAGACTSDSKCDDLACNVIALLPTRTRTLTLHGRMHGFIRRMRHLPLHCKRSCYRPVQDFRHAFAPIQPWSRRESGFAQGHSGSKKKASTPAGAVPRAGPSGLSKLGASSL